jgi:hypothetical protein
MLFGLRLRQKILWGEPQLASLQRPHPGPVPEPPSPAAPGEVKESVQMHSWFEKQESNQPENPFRLSFLRPKDTSFGGSAHTTQNRELIF